MIPRSIDLKTFWPWLQKSTKWWPGTSIWRLSGLAPEVSRQNDSHEPRASIWRLSCPGSISRQNDSQDHRFEDFLALAPKVDKMIARSISWQNDSQEHRFEDFLALAPEVYKVIARSIDLKTFRPWLQKSTKWLPGASIWRLSSFGSKSWQNDGQEHRLKTFWPWLQKSTKW